MSSDTPVALRVEHLTKRYRIYTEAATSMGEAMANRLSGRRATTRREQFLALDDVSFEVPQGQAMGVIGHNGAGKSTLFKVLSRITEPSAGIVQVRGRVGALLEVGTGFHPELTGRENVFLNGSILGMNKAEVSSRFDDIVEFAGVEEFLDVPVKRYSSGMQVRLAFSVAASLTADVLIVDEVLAVGDAEFQKKCMGRMAEVSSSGRTVLFVSHNLAAVEKLCSRVLLLQHGHLIADGEPQDVISEYLARLENSGQEESPGVFSLALDPTTGAKRNHLVRAVVRRSPDGPTSNVAVTGGQLVIDVDVVDVRRLTRPQVSITIATDRGGVIATMDTSMAPPEGDDLVGDDRTYRLVLDPLPVLPGNYLIDVGIREQGDSYWADNAERGVLLTVVPGDVYGSGVFPGGHQGLIYLQGRWTVS